MVTNNHFHYDAFIAGTIRRLVYQLKRHNDVGSTLYDMLAMNTKHCTDYPRIQAFCNVNTSRNDGDVIIMLQWFQ